MPIFLVLALIAAAIVILALGVVMVFLAATAITYIVPWCWRRLFPPRYADAQAA